MASSCTPAQGSEKTVVDYSDLLGRIVEDRHVIFNITQDPESLEILDLIRANGLERYCSAHMDAVMQFEAMEFLRNLKATENLELISIFRGREIYVSNADLRRVFDLPIGRISLTIYRCEDDAITHTVIQGGG